MRYYSVSTDAIDKYKMTIDAEVKNLNAELNIMQALQRIEYTGKVFNKRYETKANEELGRVFGRKKLDEPNYRGVEYYNYVNLWMHDDTFMDKKKYQVSVTYRGYKMGYDYDTKTSKVIRSNEKHVFYGVTSAEDIKDQARNRAESIAESIALLNATKPKLASLIKQHNKIGEALNQFNDSVPYILSEELRIR